MKILLIDDELDILSIIEIMLKKPEREFLKASTVEEAINLLPLADLILSDVGMPEGDRLEEVLNKCNKPVGRITGYGSSKDRLILSKPFLKEDLEQFYLEVESKCS